MAKQFSFEIKKGVTWDGCEFEVLVNGLPLNLTGYAINSKWINRKGGSKDFAVGSGFEITDAVNGKFRHTPFLVELDLAAYTYQIELVAPGIVRKWINGVVTVIP